jgi:hypothetical protein
MIDRITLLWIYHEVMMKNNCIINRKCYIVARHK